MPSFVCLFTQCEFNRIDNSGTWKTWLTSGPYCRILSGELADTTANTLELVALVEGLAALKQKNSTVQVVTTSAYVNKGVNEWLPGWVKRDWHNRRRQPIANLDLWQKLRALDEQHHVTVTHVTRPFFSRELQSALDDADGQAAEREAEQDAAQAAQAAQATQVAATPPPNAPSLTYVLIAGSREATPQMLDYARSLVRRAHEKGHAIMVGDNPQGVDNAVVQECRRLQMKMTVAGIAEFPRNGGGRYPDAQYVQVERDTVRGSGGSLLEAYRVRDRWMVDNAQHHVYVWDGKSPGTKAGYDYAAQRGKQPYLKNFGPMLPDEVEVGHG